MSILEIMVLAGLFCILLELIIGINTGFDLVIIGSTLVVGGAIGLFLGSTGFGLAAASTLGVLYIVFGRRLLQHKLKVTAYATNIDRLTDHAGVVTVAIEPNQPGQVVIDGETWRARSHHSLAEGTEIIIKKVDGVTVVVEKK